MPPSVGMIRSTRVFVPKSVLKDSNGLNGFRSDSREIQSANSDQWLRLLENSEERVDAVLHCYKTNKSDGFGKSAFKTDLESVEYDDTRDNLIFGTVYSRKKRRLSKRKFEFLSSDDNLQEQFPEDALFGIQYFRRNKRKRSTLLSDRARTFEIKREDHILVKEHLVPEVVLSIIVESSSSSGSMSKIPDEDDLSSTGNCKILGTRYCIPLFLVNFSAIPHSFLSLNSSISLRSQYLSCSLIRFLLIHFPSEAYEATDSVGLSSISETNSMVSKSRSFKKSVSSTELSGRLAGLYNLKWNRSSGRSVRVRKPRVMNLKWKRSSLRSVRSSTDHNLNKANRVEKVNDTADTDFFGDVDASEQCFAQPNCQPKKSILKNDIKDLKSLLAELRQNIDTVCCAADILVIEHDKCYKEVGAKVMLQRLESKEWALGIKRQGLIIHIYKAQFAMRPCATNRFTRAMIWNSESGWKLEFSNKQDWFIFKELFKECVERNLWASLAKSIPVPTALEVPGYENNRYVPFVRPDAYITVHEDEVTRALMQVANYEMDSDDEVWLEKLNINLSGEDSGFQLVSAENFGEVIDTFEKIAFNSPDDAFDEERDSNLCPEMGLGRDIVRTVYQYWLKKRKRKGSALLRVFQHQPSTKLQSLNEPVFQPQAPRSKPALRPREPNKPVLQPQAPHSKPALRPREPNKPALRPREPYKPVIRKRRSSERTSQSVKGKQQNALPVHSVDQELEDINKSQQDILSAEEEMRIDQENRQRLKEAFESANRYSEAAVSKRKRAQALMETADLALYWAAMAVKIAGAIEATGSSETIVSSFIDD